MTENCVQGKAGRRSSLYRGIYESVTGETLGTDEIDHMCSNPACINSYHLMRVPQGWNRAQGLRNRHAAQSAEVECRNGHSLADALIRNATGTRICRTCFNARRRKCRASK